MPGEVSAPGGPVRIRVQSLPTEADLAAALAEVDVDPAGRAIMVPKLRHHLLRLREVPLKAAILLKQEMLARGGEAAVARGVASLSVETTDLLLSGTESQLHSLIGKLRTQPFGLKGWAGELETVLDRLAKNERPRVLELPRHPLSLGRKTYVMGILNVTPDSFSDGGRYNTTDAAVARAERLVEEGAEVLDVGGESTRPGAPTVSAEEQMARLLPVLRRLEGRLPVPISIDTTSAAVARAVLEAGAEIINDISGLKAEPAVAEVTAEYGGGLVVMHRKGESTVMQQNPVYQDLWGEILSYLEGSVQTAEVAGIPRSRLVVDPGVGFGKTLPHNLEILRHLEELGVLGLPVLVGTSRKTFLGQLLDLPVDQRVEGTLATVVLAAAQGADFVRVHDVKETVRAVRVAEAIRWGGGPA